jgi:hypothetical protein
VQRPSTTSAPAFLIKELLLIGVTWKVVNELKLQGQILALRHQKRTDACAPQE